MNRDEIKVSEIREEYTRDALDEAALAQSPEEQFDRWFREAVEAQVWEPNAMVLSTVGEGGVPSSRVVLLKGYDDQGFVFYTNYQSQKGQELLANPHASLLFFWPELQRQIRIEGLVEKVSAEDSDQYFGSRPRSSQIGAVASPQSQVVKNRQELDATLRMLNEKYQDEGILIPRPEHWGGFVVRPTRIEFWQGRANRMHDRLVFQQDTINESGQPKWIQSRLAP